MKAILIIHDINENEKEEVEKIAEIINIMVDELNVSLEKTTDAWIYFLSS